jgi:hypothetical protein
LRFPHGAHLKAAAAQLSLVHRHLPMRSFAVGGMMRAAISGIKMHNPQSMHGNMMVSPEMMQNRMDVLQMMMDQMMRHQQMLQPSK